MLTAEYDGRCRAHDAEERPVNRICFCQAHDCAGNVLRQKSKRELHQREQRLQRRSDAKDVGRLTGRRVWRSRLGTDSRARGK